MKIARRHHHCLLALLAVLGILASGCTQSGRSGAPPTSGEISLAVALPLSGEYAAFGQTIADGVRLAAQHENESGGLLGKKVRVEVFDDHADSDTASELAQKIVASGAKAVIGHYNSGVSIAAAPVYADHVIQITPTSTRPDLTELGIATVFRVASTDASQGPKLAQRMLADGRTKPGVLYDSDSVYASGLVQHTTQALTKSGIVPATVQAFVTDTRDWKPQLSSAADADVDSLLVVTSAPRAAQLVRQARELGLTVPVYGGDSLAKEEFLFKAGNAANGSTITALLPNLVSGPDVDRSFVDDYRGAFGRNPGRDAPAGFAAAEVFFAGVKAAGKTDPQAVAKALKANDFTFKSMIGPISYDSKGDLRDQRLWVNLVENREFVQID